MSQQPRSTFVLVHPNEILAAQVGLKDVRVRVLAYMRRELGALAHGVDVAAGADHLEKLEHVRLVQGLWVLPFDV